jgi:epoxyqueuosine reductase
MTIRESVTSFTNSIGIDAVGFLSMDQLKQWEEVAYTYLPSAKSCIAILLPYPLKGHSNSSLLPNQGRISEASVSYDYHKLVGADLDKIKAYIDETFLVKSVALCDTHQLPERVLSVKAGLGIIGRNSFLVNENYGTSTNIGLILTELELIDDLVDLSELDDLCIGCNKCIASCPNSAINEDRTINVNVCISYLTQKKELSSWDMDHMNRNIYGCDYCQMACPYTQRAYENYSKQSNMNLISLSELIENQVVFNRYHQLDSTVDSASVIDIDNATFKNTLKKTSAGWIGKKRLQRNAIVSLRHHSNELSDSMLDSLKNDQRIDIVRTVENTIQSIKEHQ